MTTYFYRKTFLILFIKLVVIFYSSAQIASNPFSKFISGNAINKDYQLDINSFYLLEIPGKENLKRNEGFKLIKKLSQSHFIIKIEENAKASLNLNIGSNIWLANNKWKMSGAIFSEVENTGNIKNAQLILKSTELSLFKDYLRKNHIGFDLITEYPPNQSIVLVLHNKTQIDLLLNAPELLFIDYYKTVIPQEEAFINFHDISFNKVNLVHHHYPSINGEGYNTSIKEQLFDTSDIDLINRAKTTDISSDNLSQHATSMATIIGGAGNSSVQFGKGAAWKSLMYSSSFENILPDADSYFQELNINIQNHSYGLPIDNYYSIEAQAYDQNINNLDVLHIFSAGNSGDDTPETGRYAGIPNYANITGNIKMAKNNLLVGAINGFGRVSNLSSRGPAYDGRIKPELVAYGHNGTSDAAALVSGISLLLQDYYQEQNGSLPASALIKSILISGANDVGATGIDFTSGYGQVNAYESFQIIENNNIISQTISSEQSLNHTIEVPDNTQELIISLVWIDPAANVDDQKALMNDLDLTLENTLTQETWLPWGLNTNATFNELQELATRKEDHLNNVEYLTVSNPESGTYEIKIKANALETLDQEYFISYRFVSQDKFLWTYPTSSDHLEGDEPATIKWDTNIEAENIIVEAQINNGEWTVLEGEVAMSDGLLVWNVLDVSAVAQLRINDQGTFYYSEQFSITPSIRMKVGANCTSNFNLFWETVENAESYNIYKLENGFFEPLLNTDNTDLTFSKSVYPDLIYAVSPVYAGNQEGRRSFAVDYDAQGVNCYYTSFFATVDEENARAVLKINLSSTNGLKSLFYEKLVNGNYEVFHTANLANVVEEEDGLFYVAEDTSPDIGRNIYRARVESEGGDEAITEDSEIYYAAPNTLIVYPNPIQRGGTINILSDGGDGSKFQLFNTQGKLLYETDLPTSLEELPLPFLAKGIYIYRNYKNDQQVSMGRLMVY